MEGKKIIRIIREAILDTLFGKNNEINIEKTFNFSKIPTEELNSQYVDYSFRNDSGGYRYSEHLNEDVDLSQQASYAKSEMIRIYNMKDWQIQIVEGFHKVEIIVLYAGIFKNTRIIKDEMKRLGFFPSKAEWERRGFMIWKAMRFEPYEQADKFKNKITSQR